MKYEQVQVRIIINQHCTTVEGGEGAKTNWQRVEKEWFEVCIDTISSHILTNTNISTIYHLE